MAVDLAKKVDTFEKVRIAQLTDDENVDLNFLRKQLWDKTPRNLLRSSYYDGKHALRSFGTMIPPYYMKLGTVLGWSAKAVDIPARRCNLDTFVWPDGTLSDIGFDEVWEGNHLGSEISSAMISSMIHGASFLVNTLGDSDAGETKGLIHVKDALSATGEWNARTRRLDNLLSIISWDEEGKMGDFALYLNNLTLVGTKKGSTWEIDRKPHKWGMPAELMAYKPRVGRPFGQSRISRPVISLQDGATRTVIRMEGHADVYSWPEMWMLGADEKIFKNADGSPKANWQIMLGRIKGIPDDDDAAVPRADVKQFPAQSPQPHIDQLKQQAQLFSGETSIPLTSLGVSDMSNPTSPDSYIASREDLISEVEGATDDWSPPLKRAVTRALAMQDGKTETPKEWKTIAPKFRPPIYTSRAAMADAGMKQLTAVPWLAETEVGLQLLGLTEQQIKLAMAEKRKMAGSAALRAIGQVAATRAPQVVNDANPDQPAQIGPGSANGAS